VSKIISVHSFRGGTGKSNLSANLAVTTAAAGRRVGTIDTDIQSPGVHVLFGLQEGAVTHALNDYLWRRCRIEETAYDVQSLRKPGLREWNLDGGRLFLIPSSIDAGDIARVLREGYDPALLNDGLRELTARLNLDVLFIDTHPGVNEETLLSIAISDALVILLRPDQQDYQGTAVTVDLARRLGVPQMLLVLNKVLPAFDPVAVREQTERTFGATVAGVLPLSEEMVRLGSSDIFCLQYPDHPFSRGVRLIAERLMGSAPGKEAPHGGKP
jgi:MinD-like ATPase involved in chromosome partitioning or flagellar assembly